MRKLRTEKDIMQNWKGNLSKSLVSICCITYNHEPYIEDALEGFLIQKTDFAFEILIHDDASIDRTADIIREYQAKYPNLIKPIFQTVNQYSKGKKPMFEFNFPRAIGEYIALCEGDDYWIDRKKLQKQVNFLRNNHDYSICFHKVKIDVNGKLYDDFITRKVKETSTIYDLALGNYIHTPSVVYRKKINRFPDFFHSCLIGDYPLHMIFAEKGKIMKIDEVMACYRIREDGLWGITDNRSKKEKMIRTLIPMISHFKYDKRLKVIIISKYYYLLFYILSSCLRHLDFKSFLQYLRFFNIKHIKL